MATQRITDDTRQAQHLAQEDYSLWLDDTGCTDEPEDEYHSDPATIAEHREAERGFNSFGRPIN